MHNTQRAIACTIYTYKWADCITNGQVLLMCLCIRIVHYISESIHTLYIHTYTSYVLHKSYRHSVLSVVVSPDISFGWTEAQTVHSLLNVTCVRDPIL